MDHETSSTAGEAKPSWRPLPPVQRRVLGVLIEKAKTTPDAYPLSLNAIRNGCNQKSNRSPLMELEEDEVLEAVDHLRDAGAVLEVQGSGRVPKYRHMGYEWLAVDKFEIAIVTELLLRGAQTIGELRTRAARMERIADVAALRPLLDSLQAKGLVDALTPEGRGQIVTHTLYPPQEMERIRAEHGGRSAAQATETAIPRREEIVHSAGGSSSGHAPPPAPASAPAEELADLRRDLSEAKAQIAELRGDLGDMRESFQHSLDELQRFKEELGG